jgi:hypothetical protein
MRKAAFKKFNEFIINPDIANKFLISNIKKFPNFQKEAIYLMYIFRQKSPYNFIAIKSLLMLNSVFSKMCQTNTKVIILKFSKAQSHSIVFIKITFNELINIMSFFNKKPANIRKTMTSYLSENKHFLFPGFIKHLKIPSWKQNIKLSFQGENEKNYWLFFYKTIYFD